VNYSVGGVGTCALGPHGTHARLRNLFRGEVYAVHTIVAWSESQKARAETSMRIASQT
jgi:hypothetical protein